jgi:tetratricopeptide (TPR) repeat protein
MKQTLTIFALLALCGQLLAQGGGRIIFPEDPVEKAKRLQVEGLLDRAKALVASHDDQGTISVLQEAAAVEATMRAGFQAFAEYRLARMYVKLNRIPDAMEAYKHSFAWDPRIRLGSSVLMGDLNGGSGYGVDTVMEYAALLAKAGRQEDAKAMYYYGQRAYWSLPRPRSQEPVPFVVVFDPEPEGIQWE